MGSCLVNLFKHVFQMCGVAVRLTGDICRALKNEVLPFFDEIMTVLLVNLGVNVFSLM
jgi:importin subunit beta-1